MALMFPRLARNFARNGYYPTDEATLARTLSALVPGSTGKIRILDPCAGEGVAVAECAHALGRDRIEAFAVEYDHERAEHARSLVDRTLRSDLMDAVISRQSFGLLWLNPPYGDLPSQYSETLYQGSGRKRLEKLFYQRSYPLLQYGGVLVFIIPHYVLDAELSSWLTHHFTEVRIYQAPEQQFKQVVIFGIRSRRDHRDSSAHVKSVRECLIAIGTGETVAEVLPEEWPFDPYTVPAVQTELKHFYRLSLEPEQFALEMRRLGGLWPEFQMHFNQVGVMPRQPARALSPWHLALSLAAGAISGVITSATGKTLVVKGNTYKAKTRKVEFSEDEHGNIQETRIMIDKFVPVIKAWDMTPDSASWGCVLTISSSASSEETDTTDTKACFEAGQLVVTHAVDAAMQSEGLDVNPYLKRHFAGDWGDICQEDWQLNERALQPGENSGRLFSMYKLDQSFTCALSSAQDKLYIITEWDRSVTTVLFPSDY